jgi:hypothetical protein
MVPSGFRVHVKASVGVCEGGRVCVRGHVRKWTCVHIRVRTSIYVLLCKYLRVRERCVCV